MEGFSPDLLNKVALVIPTHLSQKGRPESGRPPETKWLQKTLESLRSRVLGFDQVLGRVIINSHSEADIERYIGNVADLLADYHNFSITIDDSSGYKGVRCNMPEYLSNIKPPIKYFFIIEHDWEFLKPIHLPKIIEAFETHSFINYIRFNKRGNTVFKKQMASGRMGGDLIMMPEKRVTSINLCATTQYSNNPHIERVDKLKDEWIPLVRDSSVHQGKNMGAGGFEHPIQEAAFDDAMLLGYPEFIDKWGLYIYGRLGEDACIRHFGK